VGTGLQKAGVGHLRIRDMRHTCASLAIAAGADLKVLQRTHKDRTRTARHARDTPSDTGKAATA